MRNEGKEKTPKELKDLGISVLAGLITWGFIEFLKWITNQI